MHPPPKPTQLRLKRKGDEESRAIEAKGRLVTGRHIGTAPLSCPIPSPNAASNNAGAPGRMRNVRASRAPGR